MTLPSVWRPPQPQDGRVCLEASSLPLRSEAAPLFAHIIHKERVKGRLVAEVGAHCAGLTSGSAARHTAGALGALFARRAAMLTARVKDFSMAALLLLLSQLISALLTPALPCKARKKHVQTEKDTMTSHVNSAPEAVPTAAPARVMSSICTTPYKVHSGRG